MVGSSLRQYHDSALIAHSQSHSQQHPEGFQFNDSDYDDDDNDLGYDSPNDISPQNLRRTLHSIMSEEKEKKKALHTRTPSPNKTGARAIAAWDMQKSPLDDVFRQRFGGIDKPEMREIYVEIDSDRGTDEAQSEPPPAWEIPKSPLDHVFRKRHGGMGEPELNGAKSHSYEEAPAAWEIPKSPYDNVFRKLHGGISGPELTLEEDYDSLENIDRPPGAAWSMPKSPLDSVFRKRVGGLGDSPSGILNAQTGEFIPGKDFPPEEDGEIRIDDLPVDFGNSFRMTDDFNDSDIEDEANGMGRNSEDESIDSEYQLGSLLTFDGRVDPAIRESNTVPHLVNKTTGPISGKPKKKGKGNKKIKRKKMSASDVALTTSWNALISPHSNFLALQKTITKSTTTSKHTNLQSKSKISISIPSTTDRPKVVNDKVKAKVAARGRGRSENTKVEDRVRNNDDLRKLSVSRVTRALTSKPQVPKATEHIEPRNSKGAAKKAVATSSSTLSKHSEKSPQSAERSNEVTRTSERYLASELIPVEDDIDPRNHPVVMSPKELFLNASSARAGNPSYKDIYGVGDDFDSDQSEEDFNPFTGDQTYELMWRSGTYSFPVHMTRNYSTFGDGAEPEGDK